MKLKTEPGQAKQYKYSTHKVLWQWLYVREIFQGAHEMGCAKSQKYFWAINHGCSKEQMPFCSKRYPFPSNKPPSYKPLHFVLDGINYFSKFRSTMLASHFKSYLVTQKRSVVIKLWQ